MRVETENKRINAYKQNFHFSDEAKQLAVRVGGCFCMMTAIYVTAFAFQNSEIALDPSISSALLSLAKLI